MKISIAIFLLAASFYIEAKPISKEKLSEYASLCKNNENDACEKLKELCMKQDNACGFAAVGLTYKNESAAIFYAKKGCSKNDLFSCETQNALESEITQRERSWNEYRESSDRAPSSKEVDWTPAVNLMRHWNTESPPKKKTKCIHKKNGYDRVETNCEEE